MPHVDQQNQAVAKTEVCSLPPERALLPRTTTHSLNIEKLGGGNMEALPIHSSAFAMLMYSIEH